MTDPSPPPSRRLRGWKLALVIGATVLLLLVGLLAMPFIIAEPFERVVAEARREGIPGSSRELGRKGDPARERITREIDVLMRGINLYQPNSPTTRFAESPHPEMVRLYHAVLPAVRERAIELAQSLRATTWDMRPEPYARGNGEAALWPLSRLLRHRWAVEVTGAADAEADLLLDSAEACEPHFGIAQYASYLALLALRPRLAQVHDRDALARRLRQLADRQWPDLVRRAESAFALHADFLRDPWHWVKQVGGSFPPKLEWPFVMRGLCRLGGAECLRKDLAYIRLYHSGSDPLVIGPAVDRLRPIGMNATTLLSHTLPQWSSGMEVHAVVRTALLARALAWHLDGQHRPIDDFDPVKNPLRSIERDGRIVALYSVGRDGVDNGGDDKTDQVWWLEPDPTPPASP